MSFGPCFIRFSEYLLSFYSVIGIILSASDMNEQNIEPALMELTFQQGKIDNRQIDLTDK